jgi:hypothetical protein
MLAGVFPHPGRYYYVDLASELLGFILIESIYGTDSVPGFSCGRPCGGIGLRFLADLNLRVLQDPQDKTTMNPGESS